MRSKVFIKAVGGSDGSPRIENRAFAGEMSAGRGRRIPVNGRPKGANSHGMFARMVAEIGGVNLVGLPQMRIGTWKGAEFSKRVVEN